MKNKKEVFDNVKATLRTAEFGLEDLKRNQADRKLAGLSNLVVFGRGVTNVLQQLRSIELGFDDWYSNFVEEMNEDPLMRFF